MFESGGGIVERGNHSGLMKLDDGIYRRLFLAQTIDMDEEEEDGQRSKEGNPNSIPSINNLRFFFEEKCRKTRHKLYGPFIADKDQCRS